MPKIRVSNKNQEKKEKIVTGRNDACKWCTLCKTSQTDDKRLVCLWGAGPASATIMFIGATLGKDEITKETPFIGEAGQLLRRYMTKALIDETSTYVTNVIKCRPPNNRAPKPLEIKACFSYLDYEIQQVKPKVIVLLGAVALKAVMNTDGITKFRGKPMWNETYQCWCVPTFHPDYILRNRESVQESEQFLKDLTFAKRVAETGKTGQLGTEVYMVDSPSKWVAFRSLLKAAKVVSVDTETIGHYLDGKILTIQFCWKAGEAWVVPFWNTPEMTPIWDKEYEVTVWKDLKEILENSQIKKVGQNIKYDYQFLKSYGITLHGVVFDTMLAHYLLDENDKGGHGLDSLSVKFTDMGYYSQEFYQILGIEEASELDQFSYAKAPLESLCKYGGKDADCTFRVFCTLFKRVKAENLLFLLTKVMIPLSFVLANMERTGVNVDIDYYKKLAVEYEEKIKTLEKELRSFPDVKLLEAQTGKPINFKSSDQLRVLLFKILKLPVQKLTSNKKRKTNAESKPSTDKSVLETLAEEFNHPIPKLLQEHRKLSKFYSTYILPMPDLVMKDGRLHTSYMQDRTVTGRLASSKPNLQNIPIKEPEKAAQVRNGFVASKGFKFLGADFKQIEFRLLASTSKDVTMINDISDKAIDIHTKIGSIAFSLPYEKVTKELREKAKTIVYSVLYGKGEENLAKETDLTVDQVNGIFDALFTRYPKVKQWMENIVARAGSVGYVINWIGRKRRLAAAIRKANAIESRKIRESLLADVKRQAVNSPIQGGAHDILSIATLRVDKALKQNNLKSRLVLTIHDALILEVKDEEFDEVVKLVRTEMEKPIPTIQVPMLVDMSVGTRLGDMTKLDECLKNVQKST
jgi:DNA polymerase-1